jgi:uncharacterized protein (DUF2249 family)
MTAAGDPRPGALDARPRIELDVREDIRAGREPFARIMTAAGMLASGDVLVVRAPFEPAPLYRVLGARGFAHWTEPAAADDWRVWFYRADAPAAAAPPVPAAEAACSLDVRGLEPPLPMVRVLERLDTLPQGATLTVLHERRPMFLYPQLEARGFSHATDEPAPGLVRIVIGRPPAQ